MDCRPPQGESVKEVQLRIFRSLREIIRDMMQEDLLHCAVITHGGMIANMLAGFGLPKISPQELQCQPGEGFDIYVTAGASAATGAAVTAGVASTIRSTAASGTASAV